MLRNTHTAPTNGECEQIAYITTLRTKLSTKQQ